MPSSALKQGPYVRPQLTMLPGGGRLKKAFFAVRNVERIIARHLTCDRAEGTAEVREMEDGRHALDLALLGCITETDEPCSETQLNNFNYHLPRMRPVEGGSRVVLVRIAPNTSCQDISRKELFLPAGR